MQYALASSLALALVVLSGCGDGATTDIPDARTDGDARVEDGGHDLVCRGTATLCEALDVDVCAQSVGCIERGRCEEIPRTCTELAFEACGQTPGCGWFDIVGRCGVVFIDCTRGDAASGCTAIPGCTWAPRCEGAPLDCAQISTGTCEDQAGCALEPRPEAVP